MHTVLRSLFNCWQYYRRTPVATVKSLVLRVQLFQRFN